MNNDSRTNHDRRNDLAVVCSITQATFASAFEKHGTDVDVVDDDAKLSTHRQIHLADSNFELKPAAVDLELCIATRKYAVDRRTRESGEKISGIRCT